MRRALFHIPWYWIVDETRAAEYVGAWDDPEAFACSVQRQYRKNLWASQKTRVECWSEKGTVRGTLAPVLEKYGVTLRVMHGYSSATVVNQVADETRSMDEPLLVLYVGDWDPSGLHMSEVDLPERIREYGGDCEIVRVALTRSNISDGGLPSFDATSKRNDSRFKWFVSHYGYKCWELDALNPVLLRSAVEAQIMNVIDVEEWSRLELVEKAERESLIGVMRSWKKSISWQASK